LINDAIFAMSMDVYCYLCAAAISRWVRIMSFDLVYKESAN